MKEVENKKDERKEKEEIDAYFSDAKKKSFPVGIIFVILFLIVIGGFAYYYFVIDSPKNIFLTILSNQFSNIEDTNTDYETFSFDYSLDTNIITNNKEYVEMVDILNKLSITGKGGEDLKDKKLYLKLDALYEEKELLGIDAYYENKTSYIKLNNIYDKVIKSELEDLDDSYISENDPEYTQKIDESLSKNVIEVLKNANYTKEYVNLNDTLVKKITLLVDEELMKDFYNRLLDDNEFMENYSKSENITESELEEQIKEEIDNLDNESVKISLYLSILENKFSMLEIISDDIRLTVTEENEEFNYKYYENSIIKYQGYISFEGNENDFQISFSIEDIEEQLNIELNLNMICEYNQEIDKLDTTNAVDYESLTENDMNKILENISNNQTLNKLLEDISALEGIEDNVPVISET